MVRQFLVRATLVSSVLFLEFAAAPISLNDTLDFERVLAPGETHAYELTLKAGDFLRLSVEPQMLRALVTLESPTGEQIVSRMRSHLNAYAETISTIAKKSGTYQLRIQSMSPKPGHCLIRVVERRPTRPGDRDRVEAERLFAQAKQLQNFPPQSMRGAIAAFEQALERFRRLRDDGAAADSQNEIGVTEKSAGEYRKSLDNLFGALAFRQCLPDSVARGKTLDHIGEGYRLLGELRKAIIYYDAALGEKNPEMPREVAMTLHALAIAREETGDEEALPQLLRVLELARESGEPIGEGFAHDSIATYYNNRGEWEQALYHGHEALRVWRTLNNRRGEATALMNVGWTYESMGQPERALVYYQKALVLRRDITDPGEKAQTLWRIGRVYSAMGELDRAIEQHLQALAVYGQTGGRIHEAEALTSLGLTYAKKRDPTSALKSYTAALSIVRAAEIPGGEAWILEAIAEAQLELGRKDEARASVSQAVEIFHSGGYPQEGSALLVRARIERASGNLAASRADAEASIRIADKLRGNISTPETRATFIASVWETYELYIDVLMRLHAAKPGQDFDALALRASERARARSLVDLLTESHIAANGQREREGLDRIRSLRKRISAKAQSQLKLAGSGNRAQAGELARELEELNSQYDQVMAEIRRDHPALAAVASPEPLDLAEIQREVVDSSSVLLEYSLGETRSFLWVVTPRRLFSYELPPRAEIESAVRTARETLSTPSGTVGSLRAVSEMILAPAAAALQEKRLIVVPDGALQYLPFAALPSPGSDRPLIADHEIITLPSASTIAVLRRHPRTQKSSRVLAVFADPVFERTDSRVDGQIESAPSPSLVAARGVEEDAVESEVERSTRESGLVSLPRLPFTRREATAVLSLVPPSQRKQALDFEANRQNVMDPELEKYRFVHFATHGLLNNFHPELSGIVLSMVDEKGKDQDGFLSTADVFNLSLSADLVVLSGCRTGLGKEIRGEGIAGLTSAFMYAGAPRVVASLWNVNDAATAELMKRFYQGMLGPKPVSPAAALRAAQLELQKEPRWSAPYYWAAFVIQGEWK